MLVEEQFIVFLQYFSESLDIAVSYEGDDKFLYTFGKELCDDTALFIVGDERICECIGNIAALLKDLPCSVSIGL